MVRILPWFEKKHSIITCVNEEQNLKFTALMFSSTDGFEDIK